MSKRRQVALAAAASVGLFLLVQLGALALVRPFQDAGFRAVENPQDPTNSLLYVGVLLVATVAMLVVLRYDYDWLLRLFIVGTAGFISAYVFSVVLPPVTLGGVSVLPWLAAAGLAGALLVHPEWYVIDAAGVVMGAGAAGLFGISFGVLPAILLLTVLAVYDAISVYGTEHMLTLAAGVMEMKVPVILVVPLSLDYSFLAEADRQVTSEGVSEGGSAKAGEGGDAGDGRSGSAGDEEAGAASGDEAGAAGDATAVGDEAGAVGDATAVGKGAAATGEGVVATSDSLPGAGDDESATGDGPAADDGGSAAGGVEADPFERDAFYIGLGDAVMPAIMTASAAFFVEAPVLGVPGIAMNLPALGALVGTLLGLLVLIWLVMKGRAHAGLPLLNGGAIAGYLLGAVALGIPVAEALGLAPYL